MIDCPLAELYGVESRTFNQAARRNLRRFPEDFMFQLTVKEFENWKSQIVISNSERMSIRKAPLVFTEQGIAMLSSVLNSDQAISVNIQIMLVYVRIREMIQTHKDLIIQMDQLELKVGKQDEKISIVFEYLKKFVEIEETPRKKVGYKRKDEL